MFNIKKLNEVQIIFTLSIQKIYFMIIKLFECKTVHRFFLEKEIILDLWGSPNDHQTKEWIIETDPNHILYFSFLINDVVDEQQKNFVYIFPDFKLIFFQIDVII